MSKSKFKKLEIKDQKIKGSCWICRYAKYKHHDNCQLCYNDYEMLAGFQLMVGSPEVPK